MSDVNDIVAVGLDLKPKTLVHAYENGVFPWPSPGLPLLWYCPTRRAVIHFDDLHVGKRLRQYLKKAPWTYTSNRAFARVIEECSQRGPEDTWITDEMKAAYIELHRLGHAHSIEVWNGDRLVGGLYGVDCANYFAGESMFHREDNASKGALLHAIARLRAVGREWMDTQVITPHVEALGAREISRRQFLSWIKVAKEARKLGMGLSPFEPHANPEQYADFEKWLTPLEGRGMRS